MSRGIAEVSVVGALEAFVRASPPAGLLGGLWLDELPDAPTLPAGVLNYPQTTFQWSMEGLQSERPRLVVRVIADAGADAELVCRRTVNKLLDAALNLGAGTAIQLYVTDLSVRRAAELRGPLGKNVYEAVATFDAWVTASTA